MHELPHKIQTAAEGEQVLQASYRMMAPLGVPTLIIDPAEYDPRSTLWCVEKRGTIEERLKENLQGVLQNFYGGTSAPVRAFEDNPGAFWMTLLNKIDYCTQTRQMVAHSLSVAPLFNVVICPRTHNTGALLLKHGLKMAEEQIADMPGSDTEWNFIRLWHEFGHGLHGASEAEADKVSALIHRHVFPEPHSLMVLADFRAAWAMINHQQPQARLGRGWALVDTLDQVVDQVVEDFDGARHWSKTLRQVYTPAPAETGAEDVYRVGSHLKNICKLAFQEPDLLMLSMMADHAALTNRFDNYNQMRIARRFALAAQRLALGRPAYMATAPQARP